MPTLDRDELRQYLDFERTTVIQQSHLDNQRGGDAAVGRKRKRASSQTMILIKEFMAAENRPVTMLQICDHLKRAPGPHLRSFMRQMVELGEIEQTHDFGAGPSIPRFLYTLKR